MALRDLSIGQMLQTSKGWLDDDAAQLKSVPQLAPWVGPLRTAHDGLVASDSARNSTQGAMAALMAQQADGDLVHDRLLRGGFTLLSAFEQLHELVGGNSGAFGTLRGQLFPGGLAMTQASYADEAAQAELAKKRVTPETQPLLATKVGDTTLDAIVEAWLASAAKLGELEAERNALVAQNDTIKATAPNTRDARNAWIKVVSVIQASIAALDDEAMAPEARTKLLATLRRYEDMAGRGVTTVEEEPPAAPAAPAPPGN